MKRWQKIAGGVAGLALLGGGVSYAAIPNSNDGTFHACVTNGASNGQHTVKILDQGGTCDAYSTEKVWNATGPQGPAGPQGAQGADGEDGATGPQGEPGGSTEPRLLVGVGAGNDADQLPTPQWTSTPINHQVPLLMGQYVVGSDKHFARISTYPRNAQHPPVRITIEFQNYPDLSFIPEGTNTTADTYHYDNLPDDKITGISLTPL